MINATATFEPQHSDYRFPRNIRRDAAHKDYLNIFLTIFGWLCYCVAAAMAAYAVYNIVNNENIQRSVATNIIKTTKTWPTADVKDDYDLAKAYNDNNILKNNMKATGDAVDPNDGQRLEVKDEAYQKALNLNDSGAMAVLRIPKISAEMAIYHGTTDDVLTAGVGHIYGTALPIGEKGTTSAISAHSGGVNGMFFTRLPQLKTGDFIYINVLGDEQGYQVEFTKVVNPDKLGNEINALTEKSKKDGKARIFASTCWPIGVNTDRWYLSAVKKSIPHPVPPSDTQKDTTMQAVYMALAVFILLVIIGIIFKVVRKYTTYRKYDSRHCQRE